MISLIIDGIIFGLQLSLLAVGLTLIFGLGGVLNLAHGQLAVIAGISAAGLIGAGVNVPLAALLGVLIAGASGLVLDRSLMLMAYRYKGEARLLLGLVLTLGLSLAIEGYLNYSFPLVALSISLPILNVTLFGIVVRTTAISAALIAILTLLSLFLFLRGTFLGKAIRSIVQNEVGAELCGIDQASVRTLIFVLGALMAGLAGIAQGLTTSLDVRMGMELTILALIVATVGGVRSINGTLAAGILLGVVNVFASFYIGTYLTYIILLTTAGLTILLRPSGLLGYWT
jgi:branched-chain amino acid transport system permease protein